MPERLQKILAAAGLGSRRRCEEWIKEGRVSVDGKTVMEMGVTADPATQRIEFNGRVIPRPPSRHAYILLNKPRGYASTLSDPHAAHVVTELVDLPGKPLLRPVGRLDIESEGLIFLTDDGEFIHHLTHPRFEVEKQYTATVRGMPSAESIQRLRDGVYLDDGVKAKADRVRLAGTFPQTDTADLEMVLHEGRNRIIRRMCSAIGHPVARLVRTRIGFVTRGSLPPGGWRHLTAIEVRRLTAPKAIAPAAERSGAAMSAAPPKSSVRRYRSGVR